MGALALRRRWPYFDTFRWGSGMDERSSDHIIVGTACGKGTGMTHQFSHRLHTNSTGTNFLTYWEPLRAHKVVVNLLGIRKTTVSIRAARQPDCFVSLRPVFYVKQQRPPRRTSVRSIPQRPQGHRRGDANADIRSSVACNYFGRVPV